MGATHMVVDGDDGTACGSSGAAAPPNSTSSLGLLSTSVTDMNDFCYNAAGSDTDAFATSAVNRRSISNDGTVTSVCEIEIAEGL